MTTQLPWTPTDPLGEALHLLRMRGAFYCRTEVSAPWALEMPAFADSLSFHVVTAGSCWLEVGTSDAVELRPGDLALVPHGRGHILRSAPGVGPPGRVDQLPQRYLGEHYSALTYGGGGEPSRLICGVVAFDEPAARALIDVLPDVIHVGATATPEPTSVHDTVRLMAAELADLRPGGEAVTTRLADILVVQAIRTWLAQAPEARTGWLGALQDERIGRALTAIHREPGKDWTLERLARQAAMSRSSFAARFTDLVGVPPMTYLTRWRMAVADARLQEGAVTVSGVAASMGYRSEAAFSRAFTRVTGHSPGSVRRRAAS
jgi:AraC-like DNA-binding protein